MLAIEPRAARATWTVFLIALAIYLTWLARKTIVVFTLALFFAYMISPLVDMVARVLPGRKPRRMLALALVYLALLAVIGFGSATIGSRLADEAASLAQRMPDLVKNADRWSRELVPGYLEPLRVKMAESVTGFLEAGSEKVLPFMREAGGQLLTVVGNAMFVVLIPILSFFFLKDAHDLRTGIVRSLVDESGRKLVDEIFADLHLLLGQYIRALVILSAATFVFYMVAFQIMGVPYAVLLAGIAAPLEFVPVIGPLTAWLTAVVVAAVSGYPHVLWIVVFALLYRLFQDYVLSPYLMSSGIELHPLLVLFGVLAGEQVAGIAGMFFSVPLIAILRLIFVHARRARERARVPVIEA